MKSIDETVSVDNVSIDIKPYTTVKVLRDSAVWGHPVRDELINKHGTMFGVQDDKLWVYIHDLKTVYGVYHEDVEVIDRNAKLNDCLPEAMQFFFNGFAYLVSFTGPIEGFSEWQFETCFTDDFLMQFSAYLSQNFDDLYSGCSLPGILKKEAMAEKAELYCSSLQERYQMPTNGEET